jgi:caffeoyl-CoA O-methyltransferase
MAKAYGQSDERLAEYAERTFQPQDAILVEVLRRAKESGLPEIHVGPMDGLHLEVLTRAAGAVRAVEIGTLGGYSGICIARGLAPGGKLFTLEVDNEHADVAREAFELAGVADRVEVIVGPALDNLPQLADEGPFDLVFIDADKENYPGYLNWAAEHLRLGGLAIGDNTFAWGGIPDAETRKNSHSAGALHIFNEHMATGGRFRATILPTGEGLTVGVKIR